MDSGSNGGNGVSESRSESTRWSLKTFAIAEASDEMFGSNSKLAGFEISEFFFSSKHLVGNPTEDGRVSVYDGYLVDPLLGSEMPISLSLSLSLSFLLSLSLSLSMSLSASLCL